MFTEGQSCGVGGLIEDLSSDNRWPHLMYTGTIFRSDPAAYPESSAHISCVITLMLTDSHCGICHYELAWLGTTIPSGGLTVVESAATE